jgi:hypothetical protein
MRRPSVWAHAEYIASLNLVPLFSLGGSGSITQRSAGRVSGRRFFGILGIEGGNSGFRRGGKLVDSPARDTV